MDAKSASSASKSAASVLSSGSSAATRAASSASASLSSASVRASGTAAATAADVKASAAGFTLFGLSAVNLSIIGIILGAAYYNGYLDGIIAQLQALLGQAQDKKEQVMKDQTGHRHVRDAASEQYSAASAQGEKLKNQATAQGQKMMNQAQGQAQQASNETRAYTTQSDNTATGGSLFSDAAH